MAAANPSRKPSLPLIGQGKVERLKRFRQNITHAIERWQKAGYSLEDLASCVGCSRNNFDKWRMKGKLKSNVYSSVAAQILGFAEESLWEEKIRFTGDIIKPEEFLASVGRSEPTGTVTFTSASSLSKEEVTVTIEEMVRMLMKTEFRLDLETEVLKVWNKFRA